MNILGMAPMSGVLRAADIDLAAIARCTTRKFGAPVAEGEHEAQPHDEAEPVDAHGICRGRAHVRPASVQASGAKPPWRATTCSLPDARPAAGILERQENQRHEARHDQEKLQHFVVDRRGQPAEAGIDQHDDRRSQDADIEIPAEEDLHELRHGEHGDA